MSANDTTLELLVSSISEQVTKRIETALLARMEHEARSIQPALLNVKDAAVYLGRSEQAVQHMIFQKELPVVRAGRRVHLDRKALDAWIERNKY